MIEWYKMAFQKYAEFNGRSTRNEYWWFALCNILVVMALYVLVGIGAVMGAPVISMIAGGLVLIYMLASFIPGLAVGIRRLHDVDKSGWFILIGLIPLVGAIILIVFLAKESDPKTNNWGPIPGHSSSAAVDSLIDFENDVV